MDVDDEIDRLFGLPLDEFTAARDALARELRKAGERAAAERVKALRKPPISVWTVNQLARKERMQVRSLVTAGERLRAEQAELLQGGNGSELQEAFERQREVVSALVTSAEEILRAAGHAPTDATLERVRQTLAAAAADEERQRLLEEGRLTEDLDPAGFGPLTLVPGVPPKRGPARKSGSVRGKPKPAPVEDERRRAAEYRRRIEEAEREVARARAEVRERRDRAGKAAALAARAAREAEAAKEAADEEERRLAAATAALAAAEQALRRARLR